MRPKVSIIIPHWNGEIFLKDCIQSLNKITYKNYQVVVVDNGSSDNSVRMIKDNFSAVKIIENKKNLGFAAACNQGIKYALKQRVDYVLLLNNDTVVEPTFLDKMINAARGNKTGIVGAKIYYYDDPKKIWYASGKFIAWRASGKSVYLGEEDTGKTRGIMKCDFVTGCAMLINLSIFNNIELFYEPYFLAYEDIDLCYHTKKAGWRIITNMDAKIWHKVGASRKGELSFSNGYYGARNRLFFAFKRAKLYIGGLNLLFIILPLRIVQWSLQGEKEMVKGTIIGIKDFLKNKMGAYE